MGIYLHLSLLEEMSLKVSSISQGIVIAGTVFLKHFSEELRTDQRRNKILALESVTSTLSSPWDLPNQVSTGELTLLQRSHFEGRFNRSLIPLGESSKHHWQTITFFMSVLESTWQPNDALLGHEVCFPQFTKCIPMFPEGRAFTKALPNVL